MTAPAQAGLATAHGDPVPVPLPVRVTGGPDGIAASSEDLAAMAGLLAATAQAVRDTRDQLRSPAVAWSFDHPWLRLPWQARPATVEAIEHELAALTAGDGELERAADALEALATRVLRAASGYHGTDHELARSIVGGVLHLASALGRLPLDPGGALDEAVAALPGLADGLAVQVAPLERAYAYLVTDGRPVLHDEGPDTRPAATAPPRTMADLVDGLSLRNAGRAGEIGVSFLTAADGRRRVVVDVPGTKSWNPLPNGDITSVGTDIRALAGRSTSYERGVLDAMRAAGVRPDEEVLLVGHSEGGLVAVGVAGSAVRSGRFRVSHVITAGSPVGRVARRLPPGVRLLALENTADVVPHADGAANPDRRNTTTVQGEIQRGSPGANHDLTESYRPLAVAADLDRTPALGAFRSSVAPFLSASAMTTHAYRITRAH